MSLFFIRMIQSKQEWNVQQAAYSRVMDDQWHTSWSAIQHRGGKGMRWGAYWGNCTIQLVLHGAARKISVLGHLYSSRGRESSVLGGILLKRHILTTVVVWSWFEGMPIVVIIYDDIWEQR